MDNVTMALSLLVLTIFHLAVHTFDIPTNCDGSTSELPRSLDEPIYKSRYYNFDRETCYKEYQLLTESVEKYTMPCECSCIRADTEIPGCIRTHCPVFYLNTSECIEARCQKLNRLFAKTEGPRFYEYVPIIHINRGLHPVYETCKYEFRNQIHFMCMEELFEGNWKPHYKGTTGYISYELCEKVLETVSKSGTTDKDKLKGTGLNFVECRAAAQILISSCTKLVNDYRRLQLARPYIMRLRAVQQTQETTENS